MQSWRLNWKIMSLHNRLDAGALIIEWKVHYTTFSSEVSLITFIVVRIISRTSSWVAQLNLSPHSALSTITMEAVPKKTPQINCNVISGIKSNRWSRATSAALQKSHVNGFAREFSNANETFQVTFQKNEKHSDQKTAISIDFRRRYLEQCQSF